MMNVSQIQQALSIKEVPKQPCCETQSPSQEQHVNVDEAEESPLKKRLRARKEGAAAHLQTLEVNGNAYHKEKGGKVIEVKEKHLEALKSNTGLNWTEKYYTESKKKIELFMGDSEKAKIAPAEACGSPTKENMPKESMLMKQIMPFTDKARSRSTMKSPGDRTHVVDLIKPDKQLLTSTFNNLTFTRATGRRE